MNKKSSVQRNSVAMGLVGLHYDLSTMQDSKKDCQKCWKDPTVLGSWDRQNPCQDKLLNSPFCPLIKSSQATDRLHCPK